jgi:putative ATPase
MNEPSHPSGYLPLAEKLRPKTLKEFIGQQKIIGAGSSLNEFIKTKRLPSLILWGPPGTGKTSLAVLLAKEIDGNFQSVNATDVGTKILREMGESAKQRKLFDSQPTLVFIDEIHRLNKSQQDVLLPFVEKGDFILIGATTENPSYEINRALLSRSQVLTFSKLNDKDLSELLTKALQKLNWQQNDLDKELKQNLIELADGDGRKLINNIESLCVSAEQAQIPKPLTIDSVQQWLPEKVFYYDKNGDLHYDIISAFIKSIRGSDPDAALYYFARMLKGGEDPLFIARRLIILASEDVGNADPKALPLAIAGLQAVESIGLPEAAINLSQVITYLATAPKSNRSYQALNKAKAFVELSGNIAVPGILRSSSQPPTSHLQKQSPLSQSLLSQKKYIYPHEYDKSYVTQNYWPEEIKPQKFYEPKKIGYEKHISEFLEWLFKK